MRVKYAVENITDRRPKSGVLDAELGYICGASQQMLVQFILEFYGQLMSRCAARMGGKRSANIDNSGRGPAEPAQNQRRKAINECPYGQSERGPSLTS